MRILIETSDPDVVDRDEVRRVLLAHGYHVTSVEVIPIREQTEGPTRYPTWRRVHANRYVTVEKVDDRVAYIADRSGLGWHVIGSGTLLGPYLSVGEFMGRVAQMVPHEHLVDGEPIGHQRLLALRAARGSDMLVTCGAWQSHEAHGWTETGRRYRCPGLAQDLQ